MRYSLRFLQQAGLVSTLLIGGVLGGLIAPLHSEAGTPEITLQIDGLPTTTASGYTLPGIPLRGAKLTSCPAADTGLGYIDCWAILTSNTTAYEGSPATDGTKRYWRVQVAPGQTARLRIGDNVGQDYASVIGVAFVPVRDANQAVTAVTDWGNVSPTYANTLEKHVLTIKSTNNFDSTINVNNATGVAIPNSGTPPKLVGQVAHGLRSGGEFDAGPLNVITKLCVATTTTNGVTTINSPVTTAKCDAVNNNVNFTGVGKFTTGTVPILSPAGSANNSQALSLTVGAGSKELPKVNWPGTTNATMGQVDTPAPGYPKFDCISSANSTQCKPINTYTMTATMKGPDTFVVTGGPDHFSANCTTEDIKGFNKLIIILASVVPVADKWEKAHPNTQFRALIDDAKAFLVTFNTPTDPTCPGSKVIRIAMFIASIQDQLVYSANGSVAADIAPPATGTIKIIKNTTTGGAGGRFGSGTFNFHITNGPSPDPNPVITVDSDGSCCGTAEVSVSVNAGTYDVSEVAQGGNWSLNTNSCGDGGTTGVVVNSGQTVTCAFNNVYTTPVLPMGTITINKVLVDGACTLDPCSQFSWIFSISGGSPIPNVTVNTDSTGHGSESINVPAGNYSVSEIGGPSLWGQAASGSPNCGDSAIPSVVVVTSGETSTCTFNNAPQIN